MISSINSIDHSFLFYWCKSGFIYIWVKVYYLYDFLMIIPYICHSKAA